jgi:ABC-type multidrug transport system ATPase subunit
VPTSTPDALWQSASLGVLGPTAVECHGIRRSEGGRLVLRQIDLLVPIGARVLLASTDEAAPGLLLRILAGLATPDGGSMSIAGVRRTATGTAEWARRVGYVGPRHGLPVWMTPAEILHLAGRMADLGELERERVVEAALGRYGLGTDRDRPLRRSGVAVIERTSLAAALLHDPEVVLLDEPLRTIEPAERLRRLRVPGARRTVLLASRLPASEAGLVNRLVLIDGGRVTLNAPIEDLEARQLPLSLRGLEVLAADLGPPS